MGLVGIFSVQLHGFIWTNHQYHGASSDEYLSAERSDSVLSNKSSLSQSTHEHLKLALKQLEKLDQLGLFFEILSYFLQTMWSFSTNISPRFNANGSPDFSSASSWTG